MVNWQPALCWALHSSAPACSTFSLLNFSENSTIMIYNPKRLENILARFVLRQFGIFPAALPKLIFRHLREEMCYGGTFHELFQQNEEMPDQFRTITVEPNYRGVVIEFSARAIGIVNAREVTIVIPFERKALTEREKIVLFGFPAGARAHSHVCVNADCTTITLSAIWRRKRAMIKLKIREDFKRWVARSFVHYPNFSWPLS